MYSKKIMEEFFEPKNSGVIKGASSVGKIDSKTTGEIIKIYIKVESGKVTEATFQTYGGVVAIALSSFATQYVVGKAVKDLTGTNVQDLLKLSGSIPNETYYVAELVVNAIKKAANNYISKEA